MSPVLSVVIPTYRRGAVALDTIEALAAITALPFEILIVDQSEAHPDAVAQRLLELDAAGVIRWIRLPHPSIPAAMNVGLQASRAAAVLFLDDDIIPDGALIENHHRAQAKPGLVAGMVLQPGQEAVAPVEGESFRFNSNEPALIDEFMGGNFSVDREMAISLGGFDENFIGAAYRFEAEFAHRYVLEHGKIRYEPGARIRHLAISSGGTRAHAHHLRTMKPTHSVGAYYYLLLTRRTGWLRQVLWRPIRSVRTRHHLRHPWWIPLTLISEFRGLLLALRLLGQGPKKIRSDASPATGAD